ncbi:MAG: hypothetical protein F9K24_19995 [Leptonema illini]|uniref:Uncharacterized protein n=1 Tax=Leptonema illini TaxID=183 RepID=A0A833LVQ6_9LEPT|nr:MAG: hypothetical protein F9K24_19995 [Leptonema illini]
MSDIRAGVLLSLQRSLLGMISENIRAITCEWGADIITIIFVFDGDYSPSDEEDCEVIVTEVAADFPEHTVETQLVSLKAPLSLADEILTAWVYVRREMH